MVPFYTLLLILFTMVVFSESRLAINMTHCSYDDGVQIKVEPSSPSEVSGAHEVPMDTCQGPVPFQSPETTLLMHSSLISGRIKMEREEVPRTSSGTCKALKHKIQSGRLARGQEELVVKFEPETKNELTETEIKKRERRKEQNRRAAQKCRIKKRELQSVALKQFNNLVQQNGDLKNETMELKSEVSRLKCLLQEHENSGLCKLVSFPPKQLTSPHTVFNKQASTAAPLNPSFSQLNGSNAERLRRLEELKRQASIEKIVKDLEMVTSQGQQPPSAQFAEPGPETTLDSLLNAHDSYISLDDNIIVEYLQHLSSQTEEPGNCSPCIDTAEVEIKDELAADLLKENQCQLLGTDLGTSIDAPSRRQCAVRNLNEEFARCANLDFGSNAIPETFSPSPAAVPYCNRQQQQGTVSPNNSNNSALPTPLNLEQLSNGVLHTIPIFEGNFTVNNQLSPVSPYSSCASPQSNMTSPSLFHSPAELHRCSPDTAGYRQVPSVFRFPPDARFSPSS